MGVSMINPDLRRKIKIKRRPDLVIRKMRYSGQSYYVVKDPISLRYYRFREEELFLLQQFDGHNNLDDIRHEFVEHFRPQRISVGELERFAGQLLQAGVATADTPHVGQRLYERYQQQRWDKVKQLLLNILYVKIPVFDPDRLLGRMLPWTRFLFTIPFFILACGFALSALLLVLVNWQTFLSKLPTYHDFFTWRNLLYFWLTLGVVKILHEFGHGLSCKAFGGEVHEMGILLLVLTPALYCNVTDAWMLPSKWHRVVIGAAGMYVELMISATCTFVWWYTEPGLVNTLALSIMFICSVSTVIFNGNPLLRFDGYYILADLIEIPNLRERSNKYLGNLMGKLFLDAEVIQDPYMPSERHWFFPVYAVAAYVYRWVVTIGILWFLYNFLKPYKLGMISAMLATGAAVTMVVVPVYKIVGFLRGRWRSLKVRMSRLIWMTAATSALLAASMLIPFPMRVDAPMILQPRDAATVFVQVPGMLVRQNVKDGDIVAPGAILAQLDDPELRKEHGRAMLDYERFQRSVLAYRAMEDPGKVREAQLRAEAAQARLHHIGNELDKLLLRAPANKGGMVFSPPKPQEMGTTLKAGKVFCEIGNPADLEAYVVIDHADTSLVKKGERVWLKLAGHVGDILEGKIERVSAQEIDSLPETLSNKKGGEVATTTDETRKIERPIAKSYSVQVPVANPDGRLTPGLRGIARIDVGYRSLFWRIKRYLQQTFHFRL